MVSYFGNLFWVIAVALVLIACLIINLIIQRKKKGTESAEERAKSYYERWQHTVVVLFGFLLCATAYLLFSPAGGLYTDTITLWEYWTNDLLQMLAFAASDNVTHGLTLRRILIWPCFLADAACIYAYIMLDKKA